MKKKGLSFVQIGLVLTLLFSAVGELVRFHGYLLLDLWVPIFCAAVLTVKAIQRKLLLDKELLLLAVLFWTIGLSSLLVQSTWMSSADFTQAALYGLRWLALFFLALVTAQESLEPHRKKFVLKALMLFGFILAAAGFLQLELVPDFGIYEEIGWDPHQNRLLSTWFDPNFTGGSLSFLWILSLALFFEKKSWRPWLLPVSAVMLVALFLTLSRSSYLALAVSVFVFSALRSWKILIGVALTALIAIAILPPVQERVVDLIESVKSVFVENYTLPDDSARLRFESWENAWILFSESPLLGQGFNAYESASLERGLIVDPTAHSATGSDSSLLTVLATTGILGFAPFIALYILLTWRSFLSRKNSLSAAFLAALAGLFVHSIFVNSLFFSPFLAIFWIAAGTIACRPTWKPLS